MSTSPGSIAPSSTVRVTRTRPRNTTVVNATVPAVTAGAPTTKAPGVGVVKSQEASVAGLVSSSVGGQLGVMNGVVRMASCGGDDWSGALPLLVHPLQFGVGSGGLRYAVGGVVGDLVVLPALGAVVLLCLVGAGRAAGLFSSVRGGLERLGWPSVLLGVYIITGEGAGLCVTVLLRSGAAGEVV